MDAWIPLTLAAALAQTARSAWQKRIQGEIGILAATYARFGFGLPFAILYLAWLQGRVDEPWPLPTPLFFHDALLGGAAQIAATLCLLQAFTFGNFSVGNALAKTESAQAALFGLVILGEPVGWIGQVAIGTSLLGVVMLSLPRETTDPGPRHGHRTWAAALTGLAAGALFGLASVLFRSASLSLSMHAAAPAAAVTLFVVLLFQAVAMGSLLAIAFRPSLRRLLRAWKGALRVGLVGMVASALWFTAMTLQNAAFVRALGQIELIFTTMASLWLFRERIQGRENAGIALVALGILTLLLGG
ncbi:MAG: DMT family transporter [Magnetococcales bacterium]|nr:DMT family transporter [Magnetococcales bacterium]